MNFCSKGDYIRRQQRSWEPESRQGWLLPLPLPAVASITSSRHLAMRSALPNYH